MSRPRIAVFPSRRLAAIGARDVDDEAEGKPVNRLPAGIRSVPQASWISPCKPAPHGMPDSANTGAGADQPQA